MTITEKHIIRRKPDACGCLIIKVIALTLLAITQLTISHAKTTTSDFSPYYMACLESFRSQNFTLAKQVCDKNLALAQTEQDQNTELSILLVLSNTYKHLNDDAMFEKYLALAETHPMFSINDDIRYKWLRLKAIRLHHLKNFQQSRQLFTQALQIAIKLDEPAMISDSHVDLGISAKAIEDYKTALTHYSKSLELTRNLKDSQAIGLALKSVGMVHLKLEEYQTAITYFEEALLNYQKYTSTEHYDPRIHNRIHQVYELLVEANDLLGQHDMVAKYQNKLSESQAVLANQHQWATELIKQAKQMTEDKSYETAAKKLREAMTIYQAEGITNPTEVLYLLADVYLQAGQLELAEDYALKSLTMAQNETKNLSILSKIQQLLSHIYEDINPNKALYFARLYSETRELFLNAKYDSDLKTIQHQIALEQNQNKLVSSQLENVKNKVKIQTLNNKLLLVLLVSLLLIVLIIYLYLKKKRERAALLSSINYHKNQLAVLSLSSQPKTKQDAQQTEHKLSQSEVNEQLVQLMLDATHTWMKHTGENLVELADRSHIWTITNDNGTLRTRSLDKYLSIHKMPKNPKWRNVVRTCHFVLAEPELTSVDRNDLNQKLEGLIQVIKAYYGTAE